MFPGLHSTWTDLQASSSPTAALGVMGVTSTARPVSSQERKTPPGAAAQMQVWAGVWSGNSVHMVQGTASQTTVA